MFTVIAPTTSLSLGAHIIKRPAAALFVTAKAGSGAENGIPARDTPVVDCSRTPVAGSIVSATIETLVTDRLPP